MGICEIESVNVFVSEGGRERERERETCVCVCVRVHVRDGDKSVRERKEFYMHKKAPMKNSESIKTRLLICEPNNQENN